MPTPPSGTTTVQTLLADALDALDTNRLSVALRRATKASTQATSPAHCLAGQILVALIAARRGRGDEAQGGLDAVLRVLPGTTPVTDALLAEALHAAGLWWLDEGDEPSYAQRLLHSGLEAVPPDDAHLRATISGSLGAALAAAGDLDAGQTCIRAALAATTVAADKAALLCDLAMLEADADRWQEAVQLNRQAVRYATRAADTDVDDLIQAQHALAYGLLAQGRTAEAGRIAQVCWRRVKRLRPSDPHWTWVLRRLLASHAVEVGRPGEAVRHLRAAIPAAETSEGTRSTLVAELRSELAELLMDRKPTEALTELEPAIAVLSRERGPWHQDTRAALRCAARALDGAGQPEDAERQYRRLLEHTPREAADRAILAADLGCLLADQERYAVALPYMRDAFHRFRNDPDFDPEDLGLFAASFADVLCELGLEREMDMMWDLLERPATPRRQKRP